MAPFLSIGAHRDRCEPDRFRYDYRRAAHKALMLSSGLGLKVEANLARSSAQLFDWGRCRKDWF